MKPFLSIITPVYNVESYLDRCVKSILFQPYHDIELILINDGSSDGSSIICDRWAQEDARVIVIHKDNGGVSSARNAGLEIVKGDYITFVDPDDFIAPETYVSNMNYLMEHNDIDIIQYPYCHYIDSEIRDYHKPSAQIFRDERTIFASWWSGTPLEYVVWNKIYKRYIWNGVRFAIGRTSEDTCLVADFVKRARTVCISECGLYYYQRSRKDSYTYIYDYKKHLDLFVAHANIFKCFDMFPDMVSEKVTAYTRLFRRLITAKQAEPSADIHDCIVIVNQYFPTWREIFSSHNTDKLWLSVAKILGPDLFVKMFICYLKIIH